MKKLLFIIALLVSATVQAQQLQTDLSIKYLVQQPQSSAGQAPIIVLLHGYGSNEQDLFGLRNAFPANYIIVSARAPLAMSQNGFQWYELTMTNGKREGNAAQIEQSTRLVGKFVNELVKKYNADVDNVFVMGFSQGAIMSYMAGLTKAARIKGVGILSGKIHATTRETIAKTPHYDLRLFVAHGTNDQVIPYEEGKDAADYVKSLGYKPEVHTYSGMGHNISNEEVQDLGTWVRNNTVSAEGNRK